MLRYTILSDNTLQFSISGDYKIIAMANYKKNERKFYKGNDFYENERLEYQMGV